MGKETAKDEMLNLCIQQGYVPPECNLTGMIVFGLVQEGKNPCIGCNVNCPHAQKGYLPEELKEIEGFYLQERERYLKEEYERKERINKRKANRLNNNGFMLVDTDIGNRNHMQIVVMVMKPLQEEMYVQKFEDISIAASYIPSICAMYDVQQIYIDTNGYGKGISNAISDTLISRGNNKIDIVPMRAKSMHLLTRSNT